jgi:arylsulfatase A-like enzyme
MEPRIDDGYEEFHWSHDTAPVWGLHNEYYKWLDETFGCTYSVTQRKDSLYVQNGMPEEKHQTTWCAQKAIDFIEAQENNEKPWLFSVNIYDPHHPFDPPQELLDRYLARLDEIPLPSYWKGEEDSKTLWQKQDHNGAYNHHAGYPYSKMNDYDHRLVRAAYWAMCDLVDKQVGRILDSLEKTGQRENTIVIFQSDHGEMLGDHGIYLKGPFFYDCAVKVPLIVSWPNHIPCRRYSALVELMDLPQTLLDLADLPPYEGMQGLSFAHLFSPEAKDEHKADVFCEYLNAMPWHQDPKAFASMIRTRDSKLVMAHSLQKGELYDLIKDPGETRNLFDDPHYQEVKITLLQSLVNRFARTADPVPLRKSDW